MISPELIRRYPFFAELNLNQIGILARVAEEISVEAGHQFFYEGEELKRFYIIAEGEVTILIGVLDRSKEQKFVDQLNNNLIMENIPVGSVVTGQMFGWSALIPPHKSTAGAIATTPSRVIAFDCEKLEQIFKQDYQFAYMMTLKAAQTTRDRLRSMRMESLALVAA